MKYMTIIKRLKKDLKLYRKKLFSKGLGQEEYEDLIKIEARILQHQEDVEEFEKKIDEYEKILLGLRRYLPDKEVGGSMIYWVGDNKKNRGIYVDLGAVIGHLKDFKSSLEKDDEVKNGYN